MNVSLSQNCNLFMSLDCFLSPKNIRKPLLPEEVYENPAKDLRWGFCENSSW